MSALTIELARKVLSLVDAGLTAGLGTAGSGKMCVEAAVCYALGEPHTDKPSCVAEPDRKFKIRLNDSAWSSDAARAKGLRRLSVMQLGTARADRSEWIRLLVEFTIRRVLPEAAEAAAKLNPAHADAIREAGKRCADEGTQAAALGLKFAAANAYAAADAAAAYAAATAAAIAADAADAAAAYAAATAAAIAAIAADAAAANAERDRILTISARCAEEAYERTGSPGVDLLKEIER